LEDGGIRALLPIPTTKTSPLNLQKLILYGNGIGTPGFRHVLELMEHPSSQINSISLCSNSIYYPDSDCLPNMLESPKLIELSLDYDDLMLVSLVFSLLKNNQMLKSLRMKTSYNVLEDKYHLLRAFASLCQSIPTFRLEKLTLDRKFNDHDCDVQASMSTMIRKILIHIFWEKKLKNGKMIFCVLLQPTQHSFT
jgi:hypothetical protein